MNATLFLVTRAEPNRPVRSRLEVSIGDEPYHLPLQNNTNRLVNLELLTSVEEALARGADRCHPLDQLLQLCNSHPNVHVKEIGLAIGGFEECLSQGPRIELFVLILDVARWRHSPACRL